MSLFQRLKTDAKSAWESYIQHEFVRRMADGTLPTDSFRHYLKQDYLFLKHFARAYALAIYKSRNLADIRANLAGLHAIVETEMELHVKLCRSWGISAEELESTPEAKATMAYTRFVLEEGLRGDVLDLKVALSPCMIGYGEIGRLLVSMPNRRKENDYNIWIDEYGGEGYQSVAESARIQLDALAETMMTEARYPQILEVFEQATRLEADFWQMGLMIER